MFSNNNSLIKEQYVAKNSTQIKKIYYPAIDCLRGIFVIVVVLYHIFKSQFPGGWVGVDGFFVISGFVVGSSLLHNSRSGSFFSGLIAFYIRRVRRLLPAIIFCIFTTVVLFNSTGVGNYYNNALDLIFNFIGASIAIFFVKNYKGGK